ncbi:tyrosine-type recombinase/integrase [Planomonospora sp. ID67723]|uniref:tyrosine-type recombinase/integrase n=1 Tax=Planomonospora sp. ID67723 TaxID=2738134 RepID=UPI0035A93703
MRTHTARGAYPPSGDRRGRRRRSWRRYRRPCGRPPAPPSRCRRDDGRLRPPSNSGEAAGDKWQDWDLVWCMPDGSPIDAGDDWDEWKEILELAEIDKDARVHDARHTAATLLLEQRVDIRVVQAVLGHSQLTTTKRYTHITETLASEAAARMGRALRDS